MFGEIIILILTLFILVLVIFSLMNVKKMFEEFNKEIEKYNSQSTDMELIKKNYRYVGTLEGGRKLYEPIPTEYYFKEDKIESAEDLTKITELITGYYIPYENINDAVIDGQGRVVGLMYE